MNKYEITQAFKELVRGAYDPKKDNLTTLAKAFGIDQATAWRIIHTENPACFKDKYLRIACKELGVSLTDETTARPKPASSEREEKYLLDWYRKRYGKSVNEDEVILEGYRSGSL